MARYRDKGTIMCAGGCGDRPIALGESLGWNRGGGRARTSTGVPRFAGQITEGAAQPVSPAPGGAHGPLSRGQGGQTLRDSAGTLGLTASRPASLGGCVARS